MEEIIQMAAADICPVDEVAREEARRLQSRLTKPAGSLGRLEELHQWVAGVRGVPTPSIERAAIVVAAADHGVVAEGVSAYPQEVTRQMVRNMLAGGAAVCVLAAHADAEVRLVDAGVCGEFDEPGLRQVKLRRGSANMVRGPAMSREDAAQLVSSGIVYAHEVCDSGVDAIGLGDMGIGNTTPAAAITSVIAGLPPTVTVGRGTGIDDETYARKLSAVARAVEVNAPDGADGIDVLAKVGGFELAFLAGVAMGAASRRRPVILDGYPTTAAALIGVALAPRCRDYMLASHVSAEPGHRFALEYLRLRPLLDFGLRLGEGTGAALALSMLRAALRLPREMATFDSAGVSRSSSESAPEA